MHPREGTGWGPGVGQADRGALATSSLSWGRFPLYLPLRHHITGVPGVGWGSGKQMPRFGSSSSSPALRLLQEALFGFLRQNVEFPRSREGGAWGTKAEARYAGFLVFFFKLVFFPSV